MSPLLRPLPPAPAYDIIGDVHGEYVPMRRLLRKLEQTAAGQERHVVFVGDLLDRGPDSLSVLRRVRELVEAGRASCLLGNHELNVLLGKERRGNEWFYGRPQELREGQGIVPQALADHEAREEVLLFLQRLPLALESESLRVVHACWHEPAIEALRDPELSGMGVVERFYHHESDITRRMEAAGHEPDSLPADLARQNDNPITALTSGLERETERPFRAAGRMRHAERVPWWETYQEDAAVVFGHFWRALDARRRAARNGPYLFKGTEFHDALGPRRNAFCIDYSVGYRNLGRALGNHIDRPTALMALRWPEKVLMDEKGQVYPVQC